MDYMTLVDVYQKLDSTSKRLVKTAALAQFIKSTSNKQALQLIQGKVFPNWDDREVGMAAKLLLKAICNATGASANKLQALWKKTGDLGDAAAKLTKTKTQVTLFSSKLTVNKVFSNVQKLAQLEGAGTVNRKVQLVAELLTSAKPKEAKYIIRTILGEMRIGLGEGTLRDAIVWASFGEQIGLSFDESKNSVDFEKGREQYNHFAKITQGAINCRNDFVEVALLAKDGESALENVSLVSGRPIKVMLYQKAKSIEDGFTTVGTPCALDFKYDGFRLQIHKDNGKILLFTRRLENVTKQFPDVVNLMKKVRGKNFIFDAEVIGVDKNTGKYLPFQKISQRIRRKYDIELMAKKFPVEVDVFDVLLYDGKSLLDEPFSKRRQVVESAVPKIDGLKVATLLTTSSLDEAKKFYQKALDSGNEGIMMKNLDGVYKPGSRVGFGVKVKPTMDTLEVVVTGAEWGEGKRSKWLASFIIAIRNPDSGEFLGIGRVGTGVKEKPEEGLSFGELTQLLKPLIIEEKDKIVKVSPKIILEVDYEEIQGSSKYGSGFALRFPRVVRLREDRCPGDIASIAEVTKLYSNQRARNS